MADLIDRQAVIKEIDELLHTAKGESEHDLKMLRRVIKDMLPSAQQWTPCEERLPEPGVSVLVDVADIPAGGRFPLIDEICKDGEWLNCDGSEWLALAWMPIPDPWKGEQNGEKR